MKTRYGLALGVLGLLVAVAGFIVVMELLFPSPIRVENLRGPIAIVPRDAPRHGLLAVWFAQEADEELTLGHVLSGSGAAEAGLLPGDVIIAVEGQPVAKVSEVQAMCAATKPGAVLVLKVRRSSEEQELTVKLVSFVERALLMERERWNHPEP